MEVVSMWVKQWMCPPRSSQKREITLTKNYKLVRGGWLLEQGREHGGLREQQMQKTAGASRAPGHENWEEVVLPHTHLAVVQTDTWLRPLPRKRPPG